MYYLMNIFIVQGSMGKKSQIQKRRRRRLRVNNATIIYSSTFIARWFDVKICCPRVSFGWEAHTFRTIMKSFTFALMMIMLQVITFNFHLKKDTKLSDLVL